MPKKSLEPVEEETESKISVPGVTPPVEGLLSRMVKPQTYQALVVVGMQEHLLSDSSLTYIDHQSGFLDRIVSIVTKWRDRAGYVIWVRTASETNVHKVPGRTSEMAAFFAKLSNPRFERRPQFSSFSPRFQALINREQDIVLDAPCYSPEAAREFLSSIKSHLITTLYLCGCLTDASMYRIMIDAASSSCALHVVTDCLGYNDEPKHRLALDYARESMCVQDITSDVIVADLDAPHDPKATAADLPALMDALDPSDKSAAPPPESAPGKKKQRVRTRAQHRRKQAAKEEKLKDEQKAEQLETPAEGKQEDEPMTDTAAVEKPVGAEAPMTAAVQTMTPEPTPAPTPAPAPATASAAAPATAQGGAGPST
jgi:nicotinamidase-related amidase